MSRLVPRQPVPDLALPSVDGDTWRLGERAPEHFSMLVFYRGLHCPICKAYLRDLDRRVGDFAARGGLARADLQILADLFQYVGGSA